MSQSQIQAIINDYEDALADLSPTDPLARWFETALYVLRTGDVTHTLYAEILAYVEIGAE